jgi:hypothetical protein
MVRYTWPKELWPPHPSIPRYPPPSSAFPQADPFELRVYWGFPPIPFAVNIFQFNGHDAGDQNR